MKHLIIGLGGQLGHDANAAILLDDLQVFSAQEERYSRKKHDGGFPHRALRDCLAYAGVSQNEVTDVVFSEKMLQSLLFNRSERPGNRLTRKIGKWVPESWRGHFVAAAREKFPNARFHFAWHHLSHVAGAFHTSSYERAAFLCVDGKGEDYSASMGVIDRRNLSINSEQNYENGLGLFYQVTTHYLGFHSFGSEYKVMGLAPYGEGRFVDQLSNLFTTDENGGFRLGFPVRATGSSMMAAGKYVAEATGIPPREPDEPLKQEHIDIATSLQRIFQIEVLKMARFVKKQTGERNLLFCGGCAQNCVAAGLIRKERIFDSVFNSPVGGDMGTGLGAALLLTRELSPHGLGPIQANGFYLGPEPGAIPIGANSWKVEQTKDLFGQVAEYLADGKIVAWVRGRMELGARALGARSILADPRQPGMQSRLNKAVKFRESFRPFAPLILAEKCGEWFESDEPSDFMQFTATLSRNNAVEKESPMVK